MIGLVFFFITLFIVLFLLFIKFSFYISFILDVVIVGGLAGYGSYLYIVPVISSGEAKWFWVILFAILSVIIYWIILMLLLNLCGIVGVIFNFIISVLSSGVFFVVMKSLFDSLYKDFFLDKKVDEFTFTFFKNPSFDYIIYGIIILCFGYYIHKARLNFIRGDLDLYDDEY